MSVRVEMAPGVNPRIARYLESLIGELTGHFAECRACSLAVFLSPTVEAAIDGLCDHGRRMIHGGEGEAKKEEAGEAQTSPADRPG